MDYVGFLRGGLVRRTAVKGFSSHPAPAKGSRRQVLSSGGQNRGPVRKYLEDGGFHCVVKGFRWGNGKGVNVLQCDLLRQGSNQAVEAGLR